MRRAASTTLARPRRLRSPLPPPPPVPQRSRDDPGLYRVATVPNALSAFRIAAAPAVGVLVWHGHHDAAALAGCALSLTDWLDGYLAQKLDQETICVEIKILRRARAESSHHPPRHRRDACSMAWRCRFLIARPSQDGRVIAEKMHPTHWLISTQANGHACMELFHAVLLELCHAPCQRDDR